MFKQNKFSQLFFIINFFAIFFSIAMILILFLQKKFDIDFFFNADNLYYPLFVKSIFIDKIPYSSWFASTGLGYFPDMVLVGIALLLASANIYIANIIAISFQSLLFYSSLTAYTKGFLTFKQSVIISSFFLLAFFNFAIVKHSFVLPFITFAMHTGVVIISLFILAIVHRSIKSNHINKSLLIISFFLIVLTLASDRIFLAWCLIPLLATLFLLRLFSFIRNKQFLTWFFTISLGIASAVVLCHLITPNPTSFSPSLTFSQIPENFYLFLNIFHESILPDKILLICSMIVSSVLLINFIYHIVNYKQTNLSTFFLLSFSSTLFLFLIFSLLALSGDGVALRFIFILFVLPIVSILILLLQNKISQKFVSGLLLFGSFALITNLAIKVFIPWQSLHTTYMPRYFGCIYHALDKYHVNHGISGYWDANPLMAFSNNKSLTVAPYIYPLTPVFWLTTSAWFHSRYDFAVYRPINGPIGATVFNTSDLKELSWKPKHIINCGNYAVLIYGKNQLKVNYSEALNAGNIITFAPSQLNTIVGIQLKNLLSVKQGQSGFLTTGPYFNLDQGKYILTVKYKSIDTNFQNLPWIDVTYNKGQIEILRHVLQNTKNKLVNFDIPFSVLQKNISNVEFRIYYNGQGNLVFNKYILKKVAN